MVFLKVPDQLNKSRGGFRAKKKIKTVAVPAGTCLLRAQLMPSSVSFHLFYSLPGLSVLSVG